MIDPLRYGVSFSLKACRGYQIDQKETLKWLLNEAGFRRFRLMSYWNEHEKKPGEYDFKALDQQVKMIEKAGGVITLCLGARQPRWPENHWPDWALQASKAARTEALLDYIEVVVRRYRDNPALVSWQLENEALLKKFGKNPEVDRSRLRHEYRLVKRLDPSRPIIMSTSNGWGVPIIGPIPDIIGFSYYPIMFMNGKYTKTMQRPWLHRLRRRLVWLLWRRPVFIHELQMEPWGHTANYKMTTEEQERSMNPAQVSLNFKLAGQIGAHPIDLWGAEWWYWRHIQGDLSLWKQVEQAIAQDTVQ